MSHNQFHPKQICLLSLLLIGLVLGANQQVFAAPKNVILQWTAWLDRDDPSGQADSERLALHQADGNVPCDEPVAIQCQTVGGVAWNSTGDVFRSGYGCTVENGLKCYNADQSDGSCEDYKVKFACDVDPCEDFYHYSTGTSGIFIDFFPYMGAYLPNVGYRQIAWANAEDLFDWESGYDGAFDASCNRTVYPNGCTVEEIQYAQWEWTCTIGGRPHK